MGEAGKDALRVGFDGSLKLEVHGSKVASDAGLLPSRELDEVLALAALTTLREKLIKIGAKVITTRAIRAIHHNHTLISPPCQGK